jgi:hypothetical protein
MNDHQRRQALTKAIDATNFKRVWFEPNPIKPSVHKNCPRYAYKYTTRKWADGMIEQGSIKLGTLYDFRGKEHAGDVADPDEGRAWTHEDYDPLKRLRLSNEFRAKNHIMTANCYAINRYESPDAYVYCLSNCLFPGEMIRRINPAYDGVIRVDVVRFFTHLLEYLAKNDLSRGTSFVNLCRYSDASPHDDDFQHRTLALEKHLKYSYQRELRFVFQPTRTNIQPIALQCNAFATCFSLVPDAEIAVAVPPTEIGHPTDDTLAEELVTAPGGPVTISGGHPGSTSPVHPRKLLKRLSKPTQGTPSATPLSKVPDATSDRAPTTLTEKPASPA